MRLSLSLSALCLLAGTAAVAQTPSSAPQSPAGAATSGAAGSHSGMSHSAVPASAMPASVDAAPTTAAAYVAKAGASDLYEIQSSQLAANQASSAKVKSFARMMIEHHMATTRDVTAAARTARLNPQPPTLEPAQAAMIEQLRPLNGEAFDRAYTEQQKTAHQMALNLHQTYADRGDQRALKAVAAKAVPIVQRHITELRGM